MITGRCHYHGQGQESWSYAASGFAALGLRGPLERGALGLASSLCPTEAAAVATAAGILLEASALGAALVSVLGLSAPAPADVGVGAVAGAGAGVVNSPLS